MMRLQLMRRLMIQSSMLSSMRLCRPHTQPPTCRAFSAPLNSSSSLSIEAMMVYIKGNQEVERISPEPQHEQDDAQGIEKTCQRITIRDIRGSVAETLSDVLLGLGAQSVVVSEHRKEGEPEQKLYDIDAPLWDLCDLDVHIALEEDPASVMRSAQETMEAMETDLEELKWSSLSVENVEWVTQIKESYVPLQITSDLYIIPEWSQPIDLTARNIILQPGVAFGTGEHPTTRLCLIQIRKWGEEGLLKGKTIMDYGSGSGVLAIAALLYGASHSIGTDTDALAVRSASRNADLNGLSDRFHCIQCTTSSEEKEEPLREALSSQLEAVRIHTLPHFDSFDIVVSNILRGPLIDLQPRLSGYLSPGGLLLLSGILESQAAEIVHAYKHEFRDFNVEINNGWASISAVKV